MKNWLQKTWGRILLLAMLVLLLALTTRWWLLPVLNLLDANSDRLQSLDSIVSLLLVIGGLVLGFLGLRRRNEEKEVAPVTQIEGGVEAENGAVVTIGSGDKTTQPIATSGGVAAGQIAFRVEGGDVIFVADPDVLWHSLGRKRPAPDLAADTKTYLAHIVTLYRYLDFRGMGMSDRVALKLSLLDMYVPLKARVERPQGDTWARDLHLAGRKPTPQEAEVMGQRLSEPLPLLDLLKQDDGLIILGDPGAGKTTFLKYLALHLALGRESELGLEKRLPLLLPLSAYATALAKKEIPLHQFIATYYQAKCGIEIESLLQKALAEGGVLLLLDGLDEVKSMTQRRKVVDRVMAFFAAKRQQGNKFILTSRIVGYGEVRPTVDGMTECTLVDFDMDDIHLFVNKWTAAIETLADGSTRAAQQTAVQERDDLLKAVDRSPGVRRLASNPLLLTVLALMKRNEIQLPERRVELYEAYVKILLQKWNLARSLGEASQYAVDVKATLKVLAPLALWMHATSPGVGLVRERGMRRELKRIYTRLPVADPEAATERFLEDVHKHANLLVERGAREYGFIHLTFQEYLAAVAIVAHGQEDVDKIVAILSEHVDDDNWHEVSLLTVGYLGIVQERDKAAATVLSRLVTEQPGEPGTAVVLAGQALLDAWPVGVALSGYENVTAACHALMIDPQMPPRQRLAAGLVLADLDIDPPGLDDFVTVPGWDFAIGRYPVTNKQYQRFIDAGGYAAESENRWWSEEGRRYKQRNDWKSPRYWQDDRFNHSSQPVVGISWYEANAYCAWLTAAKQRTGVLQQNQEIRLPTQAQWMQAAGSRQYPWGETFDAAKANTEESELGQTSPVHMYPDGVSSEGIFDLSGNVWEWTADLATDGWPWQKGGAWYWNKDRATTAARDGNHPLVRNLEGGFRVVVVPILRG